MLANFRQKPRYTAVTLTFKESDNLRTHEGDVASKVQHQLARLPLT
jgi:hypothetical protein